MFLECFTPGQRSYYYFFSGAHRAFWGMDHMLVHKAGLDKFKRAGILSRVFSDLVVWG